MAPPRQHDLHDLSWRILRVADDPVEIGGQFLPSSFEAVLTHPDWPVDAVLTVDVDQERGPVLTGLQAKTPAGAEPVSYRRMQEVIAQTLEEKLLLRELTADAVGWKVQQRLLEQELTPEEWAQRGEARDRVELEAARMREAVRADAYGVSEPRRRRLLSREYLERVAAVYRQALEEGRPPTVAVQAAFGVSHSNASKYVRKARDVGALGPADSTRAGEMQS